MSVYFIRSETGCIKIGRAKNPLARLSMLRTGCPIELTLVAVMPGDEAEEAALHLRFAANRIRGEWFEECEEIIEMIRKHSVSPAAKSASPCSTEIARLRKRLRLSQAEFAERLGVNQATVSRLEGGRPPSKPVLRLLQQMAAQ